MERGNAKIAMFADVPHFPVYTIREKILQKQYYTSDGKAR